MRILAAVAVVVAVSCQAQDREWLAMWEEAQRARPRTIATAARIAPAGEPGTPLVVHGRVLRADGRTPAPNVVVFAYQTDATGVYNRAGARGWRLKGWAKTDANGRFEFHTIRPGSYPRSRTPAHIHLTLEGPGVPRRWAPELQFADDPFVSERQSARPVTTRNGTQHVDFHIRLTDEGRF